MNVPVHHMMDQGRLLLPEPEQGGAVAEDNIDLQPLQYITRHFKYPLPFSDGASITRDNQEWEAHTTNIEDTLDHQQRVANLCLRLVDYFPELTPTERSVLFCAAMCHDVGKFELNPKIIFKPDDLDDEEFLIVQTHSQLSSDIARRMLSKDFNAIIATHNEKNPRAPLTLLPEGQGIANQVADLILEHHEKCDGKGYPNGLSEDRISMLGRIIAVADVFDALTNPRCYRKNGKVFTPKEAIDKILLNSGTKFDIMAVAALHHMIIAVPAANSTMGALPLAPASHRWEAAEEPSPSRPAENRAAKRASAMWGLEL